jgi:N-acylneuraminate cytidylyltransferase
MVVNQKSIIAIMPARGGSKGISRKNIRPLAGKPLIAHTIGQAIGSTSISRVTVSTDDAEIATASKEYDAEVIMRPLEISTDTANSEDALIHVLYALKQSEYSPGAVVFCNA